MGTIESAERIVDLQRILGASTLNATQNGILLAEQRRLWDEDHAGRSFEEIQHDVWLIRSYS